MIRDDDEDPPPPVRTPRPEAPDLEPEALEAEPTTNVRRKRANWKRPTREIPVEQVTAEVKRIVSERLVNRIFAGAATLLLGGSGVAHFHQHDHSTGLESTIENQAREVKQLRDDLIQVRIDAARCCPKGVSQ